MADKSTSERLIKAAIDIFSSKGYSGTGVDEIAGAIGLKGPNIYKYFNGKNGLLEEIVRLANEEYNLEMNNAFKAGASISDGKSLKEFTFNFIDRLMTNELSVKLRKLFSIEQFRGKEFAVQATKYQINILMEVFIPIFGKLIDHGRMIKGRPEIYAIEYSSPLSVLIQMCNREPERKEELIRMMEDHMDFFVERFFVKRSIF